MYVKFITLHLTFVMLYVQLLTSHAMAVFTGSASKD